MSAIELAGCTPEPLMGYLKALGVLRLVSEQKDRDARGYWEGGVFRLELAALDRDGLGAFFRDEYKPTPIVVPWSGSDYFKVRQYTKKPPYDPPPSSEKIVRAFLECEAPRLEEYHDTIERSLGALAACGLSDSKQMEGAAKLRYLARLRTTLPPRAVDWLDAAAVLERDKPTYSVLVGTTGGSDSNTHLSDNFMKNLWDVLPEFDNQRKKPARVAAPRDTRAYSTQLLTNALYGTAVPGLSDDKTASLYDAGATGGANAGQGYMRGGLVNPWNFVLALEGCVALGGAITRRAGARGQGAATFPFQVQVAAGGKDSTIPREQTNREIWMPAWDQPTTYAELSQLLGEGRVSAGRRISRRGTDVALAIATLGTDRGIVAFHRFAVVRARVGGDRQSVAVPGGRFPVQRRKGADLLQDDRLLDWLDEFRRACRTKVEGASAEPPQRLIEASRSVQTAVFDLCRYDGAEYLQRLLVVLGRAERELAVGGIGPGERRTSRPLSGLSARWLQAADDGSPEFRLARSVAFLGRDGHSVRRYLEPVAYDPKFRSWAWNEGGGHIVWGGRNLARNLGAVLIRWLMESERAAEPTSLRGLFRPTPGDLTAFLQGGASGHRLDEQKLEDLIWGLSLIDFRKARALARRELAPRPPAGDRPSLPPAYALAKLTLLGAPLDWETRRGVKRLRFAELNAPTAKTIKPEPALLNLLRARRLEDACEVAARRLRAAGLQPIRPFLTAQTRPEPMSGGVPPERILAALLFPLPPGSLDHLADLVIRRPAVETTA